MTVDIQKGKKILVVLTNESSLQKGRLESAEHRTGFDVKAVAYIWEFFHVKKGVHLEFTTPSGGEAPMDPRSIDMSTSDEVVQKFLKDRSFVNKFKDTEKIARIRPEEYCAVFVPGSHGAMMDLPESSELSRIICKVYHNNGLIATLGHGVAALINVPSSPTHPSHPPATLTDYFVRGKRITCFTNEEEKKLNMEKSIPYLLEDKLREKGAKLENKGPFEVNVIREDRLITAQNMHSTKEWIQTIIKEARLE